MDDVKLSIIVPAYNSVATIKECIGCIEAQLADMPAAQIIVVDNGKNPGIETLLKDYNIVLLNRQQHQSAAYARNEGSRQSNAQVFVFIDSDVILQNGCIENLIAPIVSGESDATIGNYSTDVGSLTFAQKYKQLYIHNVYRRRPRNIKNDFWTAIAAIDARVFRALGGFDTAFGGASGEDQELGIRLSKKGYKIRQVKDALGLHKHNFNIYKIIKNDVKKGLMVIDNTINNKVPLTDHGHASKRDIIAVFFCCLLLLCSMVALIFAKPLFLLASLIAGFIWAIAKSDLIKLFIGTEGYFFTLSTLPLMFILDLVRAYCVAYGVGKKMLRLITVKGMKQSGTSRSASTYNADSTKPIEANIIDI